MTIDWPATEGDGGQTYLTISRPVRQRMIDGRTRGGNAARLRLNLAPDQ
jgi:hypothetical protein